MAGDYGVDSIGSQNTIFFHCHESVTLIHVVFVTLIAIHIFQRFFGIIPQSSGADDHSTPNQFLYVYRLLSVSNLVKPGERMNVESKPVDILLTIQKLQQQPTPFVPQIEILIDEILSQDSYDQSDVAEHAYYVSSPEQCITFYLGGYVAHRLSKFTSCPSCTAKLTWNLARWVSWDDLKL